MVQGFMVKGLGIRRVYWGNIWILYDNIGIVEKKMSAPNIL